MRLGLSSGLSHGGFVPSSINLLDFSPAAAYSLRSFDSSADPNVVNVRRSSDNATQDFKASEITDGTLATYVGSGNDGHVTTWYDQSGNSRDAVQTHASSQPKIVSSGTVVLENSKPAVDMNIGGSTSSRLVPPTSFRAANINNYSLFTAQKPSGTGYGVRVGDAPDNRGYLPRQQSGTNFAAYGDNLNAISLGSPPTDNQLISFIAGSTQGNAQAFLNGSSQGSLSLQDHAQLGASAFGQGGNTGTMQEVVMFHTDQSANRTIIEGDINTYYSIY